MVSFHRVSPPKPCMHLSSLHTCYMPRPSHSFDLLIRVIFVGESSWQSFLLRRDKRNTFSANGPKQNKSRKFSIRSIGGRSRKWEDTSRREGCTLELMSQMRLRVFHSLAAVRPPEQISWANYCFQKRGGGVISVLVGKFEGSSGSGMGSHWLNWSGWG